MIALFQIVCIIFVIVVLAEALWRLKLLESEYSRKLVHILVGTFAATWAFFLSEALILLLAGMMFLVVLISRFFGLFSSIHSVKRKTWGELFFPLGIAGTALIADSPWIFLAALLHVGLADGLAALIGKKYIKKHGYKVLGTQKTVVGSLVFLGVSLVILSTTVAIEPDVALSFLSLSIVSLAATLAENIGVYGSDDTLIPVVVSLLLVGLS